METQATHELRYRRHDCREWIGGRYRIGDEVTVRFEILRSDGTTKADICRSGVVSPTGLEIKVKK